MEMKARYESRPVANMRLEMWNEVAGARALRFAISTL